MTTTLARGIATTTVAAGAAVAVLGGCAGSSGDQAASERQSQGENAPANSAPASPRAADGTDLEQCSDAECEVVVERGDEIPMGGTQGIDQMAVDSADDERVALNGTGEGTEVNGSVGAPYPDGPVLFLNGIGVEVVSSGADHAVIAMSQEEAPDIEAPDMEVEEPPGFDS